MLTVTTGNEILTSKELTISGNTANGTVSIQPGKNIKFTAEARDGNNIIQWQGSTIIDIDNGFTVDIKLAPIPPSANSLKALVKQRSVNLTWNQNSDPDFAKYELYRSQSNSILGTLLHLSTANTVTEYKDFEASEGNTYFYTLVVTDTEGFKTENKVNINPNFTPVASDLQFMKDSLFRYLVILFWTKNADKDFARYDLYRSQTDKDSGTVRFSTTIPTVLKFQDTKVSPNTPYYYSLYVFDNKGLSTKSNVVYVKTPN